MQCISNYDQTRFMILCIELNGHIMDSSITKGSLGFIKNNMGFSTGTV